MEAFEGKWEVTSRENVDEILKAYGDEGEASAAESVALEYRRQDGCWMCVVTLASGDSKSFPLRFDEAIDSETLDGRPIESNISFEDGKLLEFHGDKSEPSLDTQITRELKGEQLIVSTKVKGIESITKYKKVQ